MLFFFQRRRRRGGDARKEEEEQDEEEEEEVEKQEEEEEEEEQEEEEEWVGLTDDECRLFYSARCSSVLHPLTKLKVFHHVQTPPQTWKVDCFHIYSIS